AHEFERYVSFTLNVNTASVEALALIPGIDASLASTIVARRSELSAEALRTPAWLLEEGLLDREEFVRVAPYLTTKSFQFRFRVIGYGIPSGRYRILEALVDVGHAEPRLIYLRELTRAGPPFPLEGREQDA
ncbi:MAG TPA: helix-hairpin-helix domain-containing protein, partial [Planctomycetota bacterium]|nr:helix-hairpin-helix domain-containing protein [Planctomycetota bacterium]